MANGTAGTNILATTSASFGAAQIAPVIKWLLDGFPHPVPDSVPLTLAALLLPVVHLVYVWLTKQVDEPLLLTERAPDEKPTK